MANESNAVIGGVIGGLAFIGIAILIGDYFYEQCFDSIYHLGEYKCLSDESVLKDTGNGEPECCTTKYSWQAWCCGLPFALIGILIIGASLSGEEKIVNSVDGGKIKTQLENGTIPKQNYTIFDADSGEEPLVDTSSSGTGILDKGIITTGSEMKNTCNRCNKIWYLATDELQDLENRLSAAQKAVGQMGGLTMISALTNPGMLTAQMGTANMAALGPVQQLQKEFEEKSRCPECQSKNIERELVSDDEPVTKEELSSKDDNSLADGIKELSKLKEQGILDDDEFKSAKKKLIEKH